MQLISSKINLDLIEQGFQALSDGLRLQILQLLRSQELCVCELCDKLDVNQSKLSFHLKKLKDANLVHARQEGRWMYYRLNVDQFATLGQYLSQYRQLTSTIPHRLCDD